MKGRGSSGLRSAFSVPLANYHFRREILNFRPPQAASFAMDFFTLCSAITLLCYEFSFNRPLGDGRVNFGHEADRLAQGRGYFAVMLLVLIAQGVAPVNTFRGSSFSSWRLCWWITTRLHLQPLLLSHHEWRVLEPASCASVQAVLPVGRRMPPVRALLRRNGYRRSAAPGPCRAR